MSQELIPQDRSLTEIRAIGFVAVMLSLASVAVILAMAPWQLRFPVVALTAGFCPGIPLLRMISRLSLTECLVYGVGANFSLIMLLSFGLVLAHTWDPVIAFIIVLGTSLVTGAIMLYSTWE